MVKAEKSVGREIRNNLEKKKIIIGTKSTIKNLKLGRIKEVYLTNNCPEEKRKNIEHYSEIGKVKVISINYSNEELGVICKKSYAISMASLIKNDLNDKNKI